MGGDPQSLRFETMKRSERIRYLRLLCRILNPVLPAAETAALQEAFCALSTVEQSFMISLADANMLSPALQVALTRRDLNSQISGENREVLEAILTLNKDRNRTLSLEARDLTGLLSEIDVKPLYLKGMAHILGRTFEDAGARMTSDIDVLIPEARLRESMAHLSKHGFDVLPGLGPQPDPTWIHEMDHHAAPVMRKDALARIELHNAFFDDPAFLTPPDGLLARARTVPQNGWSAHVPDPSDAVVMAIGHAVYRRLNALGKMLTLRDGLDVLTLCGRGDVDWQTVQKVFATSRATADLGWYLAMMETLFGSQPSPVVPTRRNRLRAHAVLTGAITPGWGKALTQNKALNRSAMALSMPQYRKHMRRILFEPDYRRRWSRNK